jgi:hypothetical protein
VDIDELPARIEQLGSLLVTWFRVRDGLWEELQRSGLLTAAAVKKLYNETSTGKVVALHAMKIIASFSTPDGLSAIVQTGRVGNEYAALHRDVFDHAVNSGTIFGVREPPSEWPRRTGLTIRRLRNGYVTASSWRDALGATSRDEQSSSITVPLRPLRDYYEHQTLDLVKGQVRWFMPPA